MNKLSIDDLIGKGLTFPIIVNATGGVDLTTGLPLLKASIRNIASFILGLRYFLGEFGLNPIDIIEDMNDEASASMLQYRLQTQIPLWDRRVNVEDVKLVRPNINTINVEVDISLNGTNIRETFVFPFTTSTVA